jgi:ADP-ribosylglycohydrolase
MSNDTKSYDSFGNGSAMRVSPVELWCKSLEEIMAEAKRSAEVTHSHPEGVKGAQATAAAIFLVRNSASKEEIKSFIEEHFQYDLDESLDSIRQWYSFDVTCGGTVPQAIRSFIESNDYEDAVRKSISLGGDSDTIACITGGIAEAYYGVPESIIKQASTLLPADIKMMILDFYGRCGAELKGLQ